MVTPANLRLTRLIGTARLVVRRASSLSLRSHEVTPFITRDEYSSRRGGVLRALPAHSVAIFPSANFQFMSEDVPHLYHQNTDLFYLSGCNEPGSALVLDKSSSSSLSETSRSREGSSILFLQPKDAEKEVWDGPMLGATESTREHFGVDKVMSMSELPTFLSEKLQSRDATKCKEVYLDPSTNSDITALFGQLPGADMRHRLLKRWNRRKQPKDFVRKVRLVKSEAEVSLLRRACSAIAGGLNDAMAYCSLGEDSRRGESDSVVRERHIEAHIEFGAKIRGADRMAFPSVVASGSNSTILHYMKNTGEGRDGDFVMVDAGCQVHGACSDVSRSWPISGTFSSPQRDIYNLVLEVQLRCMDMVREGSTRDGDITSLNSIHSYACRALTEGLIDLGFMKGMSVEKALATGAYRRWFPHSIGHFLGYDVHDTHSLSKDIPLVAGMCITIEPGIYVRADDGSAPSHFRGLGMRIEDDLLVRPGGISPEVLSHEAVKDPDDIESLVGSGNSSAAGGLDARRVISTTSTVALP